MASPDRTDYPGFSIAYFGLDIPGGLRGPPAIALSTSSAGIGAWAPTDCYPYPVSDSSCAASGGYIYCVGGTTSSGATGGVYYATLSASGVGAWTAAGVSFPSAIQGTSCTISGGYIYCIGGDTCTDNMDRVLTANDWFAPVSAAGVGAWTQTTSYPSAILSESCAISGGFIYCVGGFDYGEGPASNVQGIINAVYFAPVSSSGIGAWSTGTTYPIYDEDQNCVTSGGYIYCIGGYTISAGNGTTTGTVTRSYSPGLLNSTYFAPVSSGGVGAWTRTTSYPTAIFASSCIASAGYIYCVGGSANGEGNEDLGLTDAVCYTQIGDPASPLSLQSQASSCSLTGPAGSGHSGSTSRTTQSSSSSLGSAALALFPSYWGVVAINALILTALFAAGDRRSRKKLRPLGR